MAPPVLSKLDSLSEALHTQVNLLRQSRPFAIILGSRQSPTFSTLDPRNRRDVSVAKVTTIPDPHINYNKWICHVIIISRIIPSSSVSVVLWVAFRLEWITVISLPFPLADGLLLFNAAGWCPLGPSQFLRDHLPGSGPLTTCTSHTAGTVGKLHQSTYCK